VPSTPPVVGEQRERLRSMLVITEGDERLRRLRQLGLTCFLGNDERPPVRQEQPRAFRTFLRPELERGRVGARRGVERVQRHRPIPRLAENETPPLRKMLCRQAARLRQLERHRVVVGKRLGMVGGPSQRLDPLRDGFVLLSPFGARDLPVGHLTDEQVPEGVLRLVADRRPRRALDEAFPLEDMELLFGACAGPPTDDTAEPEDLAEDGRILEQSLLVGRQEIQSCRDDSLDRFRQV